MIFSPAACCIPSGLVVPVACGAPQKQDTNDKDNGLSIHYLKYILLPEINNNPKYEINDNIYELEDLNSDECGFIRKKGKGITCPRDGESGTALVDCPLIAKYVGPASIMLSYSWGYKIKDIVETLYDFCLLKKLDPKKTYAWICCFCNNQFRVRECRRNNTYVPFDEFKLITQTCVAKIGHIVAMIDPWYEKLYLKRVWCIYEIFTAIKYKNCKLDIIMSRGEKQAMLDALCVEDKDEAIEVMSKVLTATKVEEAQASIEADRLNILNMVESHHGGFSEFNNEINALIRIWLKESLLEAIQTSEAESELHLSNEGLARLYCSVGNIFGLSFGDVTKAIELTEKGLIMSIHMNGEDNKFTAKAYNEYGNWLEFAGKYRDAKENFERCISIGTKINESEIVSDAYGNLGNFFLNQKQYSEALCSQQKCLEMRKRFLEPDDGRIGTSYNDMALVLSAVDQLDEALQSYKIAMKIYKIAHGDDHPFTATVYMGMGNIYYKKKIYGKSIKYYTLALEIEKQVMGNDDPKIAFAYNQIGFILHEKGDYDAALEAYQKSIDIQNRVYKDGHPITAGTYTNMAYVYWIKGDFDKKYEMLELAESMKKKLELK